jgi:hypothetical protein
MDVRHAVLDVAGLKGASLSVTSPTKTNVSGPMVRGGLRRLVVLRAVLVAVVAGLLASGVSSTAVAADTCGNAIVRAQTGSTGLPDCRAYEMVTPAYKQGFPVLPAGGIGFTDNGLVSYASRGAIAGQALGSAANLYHVERSAGGWLTSALDPSAEIYYNAIGREPGSSVVAESPDLRWSLWRMHRRDESAFETAFWLRGPDGAFTRIGPAAIPGAEDNLGLISRLKGFQRGAADFSHIVISSGLGSSDTTVFEYVGTGNSWPPRLVGVDNNGQELPGGTVCSRDISSDGRVNVVDTGCGGSGLARLWARVGGSVTVAVSASECTRDAGDVGGVCSSAPSAADYAGKAVDGSRVFFTTSQQLVNGDVDQTNDVYACDIPAGVPAPAGPANACSTLTKVSSAATDAHAATDAQVQSVVAVSGDGSRVYYVARGVLADNLGVSGAGPRATPDGQAADNLYMWERDPAHPAGQTRYVARLADVGNDLRGAQMTPDGRYLLFATANSLVLEGVGADADSAQDVYRYDASTHEIMRVSTTVAGGGGNGPGFDALSPQSRAMTADGSTVVFESAEALSLSDTNGVADVYSWRNGQVSLISSGGGHPVGITASGRDIFFGTDTPVLAADGDVIQDIYDARVDGGFTPVQSPSPCSGDECQGVRSQAPNLAGPTATSGGSGLAGVAPVFSLRAVSAAQRRALAATGKVSLTVTANAPGTVSIRATATIGGRSVTVGSARQTLAVPGRVSVALTLSKKARTQLALRGRLTVRIAVNHSKVALERAVTLRLVHAKAKRSAKHASARRLVIGAGGSRS